MVAGSKPYATAQISSFANEGYESFATISVDPTIDENDPTIAGYEMDSIEIRCGDRKSCGEFQTSFSGSKNTILKI